MKRIFFLAASGLCLTMTSAQDTATTTLQTQSPDPNLYDGFPDNFWPAPEEPNAEDCEAFLAEEGFLPPPPDFDRPPFPHHGRRHHQFPHRRGGPHHGRGRHHPPPLPFDGEEAITESVENGEGGLEFDEPEIFAGFDGFRRHPPFFGGHREGPRGWGGRHHGRHHGRFGPTENVTVAEGEDVINFEDELPTPSRHHKRHHRFGDDNNGTETRGAWRPFFRRKNY